MKIEKSSLYVEFVHEIRNRIRDAQGKALQAVNKQMVGLTLPSSTPEIEKFHNVFDFLGLRSELRERRLKNALMLKIEPFLKEMGGVVAFVGRQYRIEVDDKEYFIDILLYHRGLKCLIAVELKVGEFEPEYVGKMQSLFIKN